jgi:hypothetical protein
LPRDVDKCRLQPSLKRLTPWAARRFRSQGFAGRRHRVSLLCIGASAPGAEERGKPS